RLGTPQTLPRRNHQRRIRQRNPPQRLRLLLHQPLHHHHPPRKPHTSNRTRHSHRRQRRLLLQRPIHPSTPPRHPHRRLRNPPLLTPRKDKQHDREPPAHASQGQEARRPTHRRHQLEPRSRRRPPNLEPNQRQPVAPRKNRPLQRHQRMEQPQPGRKRRHHEGVRRPNPPRHHPRHRWRHLPHPRRPHSPRGSDLYPVRIHGERSRPHLLLHLQHPMLNPRNRRGIRVGAQQQATTVQGPPNPGRLQRRRPNQAENRVCPARIVPIL